jgi:O-Antigen ligase
MAAAVALALYLPALALGSFVVWRRPVRALYLFLPGLAAHNLVASLLWGAGVRGRELTVVLAWKEVLLAVALISVAVAAWRGRQLPFRVGAVDAFALAFGALAVVYALVPESVLGGSADTTATFYGLRHALQGVAAYILGRSLVLGSRDLRRLAGVLVASAAAVAVFGLIDVYAIPVEWWRHSGAVGYYNNQLGFDFHGPGRLPENFAYNHADGVFRRLISTFISPLAAAYMFVVALLVAGARGLRWPRPRLVVLASLLLSAALLFTISRSSLIALAAGLVVLAFARRRLWPLGAAAAALAAGVVFGFAFPHFGPRTHFFASDLAYQHRLAREHGGLPKNTILSGNDPSIHSHLSSLRVGLEHVLHHPQGFGLGNAGAIARRFDEPLEAGESNYTEIGAELGIAGLALFVAWNLLLLAALVQRARSARDEDVRWLAAAIAASFAAMLALAVQTDVYGVPWLAFCVWWLGGSLVVPGTALAAARTASSLRARRAATVDA